MPADFQDEDLYFVAGGIVLSCVGEEPPRPAAKSDGSEENRGGTAGVTGHQHPLLRLKAKDELDEDEDDSQVAAGYGSSDKDP